MATTKDHSLILRKGIVAHLKADAGLTALVPASSIYGEQPPAKPAWPFIRYGLPLTTPERFDCYMGGEHAVTIHSFAKGPGSDAILTIRAAIIAALDDAEIELPLDTGEDAKVTLIAHTLSNLIRDTDEAGAYHDIHSFTVRVSEKV
jgi:hypothetical protein